MKNLLKVTGLFIGVAAVAGTTAYVLTQTDKGREFSARSKKKATEFKEAVCDQLAAYYSTSEEESVMDEILVAYDYDQELLVSEEGLGSLPKPVVEPLLPKPESDKGANRSRLIRDRRRAVWSLYEKGVDADSIADSLNLPFEVVLKDLAVGEKRGHLEY